MKSVSSPRLHYVVIFASLVAALVCRPVVAQDTWNVTGGGDWNTSSNWDTMNVPNAIGATAIIPAGFPNAGAVINVSAPVVIKTLQLDNNFTSSITGSDITFDNGGGLGSLLFNTGSWTISNNLILNDPLNVTATANGTLSGVISGSQSLQKLATGTLILGGANSYSDGTTISAGILQGTTTSLQGNISNGVSLVFDQTTTGTYSGVLSSIGSVTIQNTGTVTFTGTNLYTGNTIINGGILSVGVTTNLGSATNGLIFGGGTLKTTGGLMTTRVTTLNGGGGTIDTNGFNSEFSGVFSGAGAFTKSGTGILTLSGTNTYLGNTNINGGTLSVGANGNLGNTSNSLTFDGGTLFTTGALISTRATTLNAGGGTIDTNGFNSMFSGDISSTGSGTLTKIGTGTLTLAGTNTYDGGTNINGGTISVSTDSHLGNASGVLTFNGGTLLTSVGITTTRLTTLNIGGATIDTNGFNSTFSGVISGVGDLTKTGSGTLTLSGSNTYTGDTNIDGGTISIGANNNLGGVSNRLLFDGGTLFTTAGITSARGVTLNGGSGGTIDTNGFNSTFSGTVIGAGTLTKSGNGTLTLSGTNAYLGNTNINGGTISVGANGNLGSTVNGLTFDGGTLFTTAGITSARAVTLNGGGGIIDTNGFNTTFSAVISGAGALTKNGTGTLTLSGTNTYTGDTIINGGLISVGVNNQLGDAGNGLTLNNGTLFTTGSITMSRATTLNAGGGTINTNGFDSTFSGVLSGAGSLTKIGTGILTLSGTNTYTGDTNLTVGSISLGAANNLGSSSNDLIFAGGTLFTTAGLAMTRDITLNGSGGSINTNGFDSTFSGVFSGTGALTKFGTGNLTLSGTNTYTGDTNINGGIVRVGVNSNLGNAANGLTFNGGTLLTSSGLTVTRAAIFNGGGGSIDTNGFDSTFTGILSGTGGLTKLGAGILTVSGNNTYSGTTAINAGTLSVVVNSNLGDVANGMSFSGGTLLTTGSINSARTVALNAGGGTVDTNGFDSTLSGVISGTGGLTKIGTGTLTLANMNSYSGGTTVSTGVLQGTTTSLQGNILNNASLVFNQTGNGTYSGVISGTGTLTKQNTGIVILSGSNTYSGGTTVSAGVLQGTTFSLQRNILNNASLIFDQTATGTYSDVISGTGSLTKQNIGVVTLSGNNTYSGNTHIDGGTIAIGSSNNLGDAANVLTFDNGTIQVTTGLTISRAVTLNAGGGTIDTNSFDSTFSGVFSGTSGGGLTKIGAGTLTLSGNNTYDGDTNINAGILSVGTSNNLGDTANSLTFDGGTLFTTGAIATSRGMTLNAGGGTIDTNGFDHTFSGVIDGNGSLTKNSAGTLTLSGTSTYSGGTVINAGTISVGNNNNLGDPSGLTIDSGTLLTTAGITASRPVALNAGGGTFDTNGFNSTFSGVFSGTGVLNKNGAGTLTLSGTNTYSGDTLINAGTLQLGATNSLPFGTNMQISTGAVFDMNGNNATVFDLSGVGNLQLGTGALTVGKTNSTTFFGAISGTGSFTKNGTGILTLLGTNNYSGGTSIAAGVLKGNTSSLQGNIVTNNSTVNFDQTLNGSYTGVISGNGAMTKTGTGTTIFTGMNIYTGATTINAGRLTLNGAITSNTIVNSGGILGGNGMVTGNVTVNSGGTLTAGSSIGTLNITGDLTQAVGSFLEVEVQTATIPTNPGVDNDLVDVTGDVTLNGGTVNIKGAAGTYTPGAEYVFLQYSGTRTGMFTGITNDLKFLNALLVYNMGNVAFVLEGVNIPDSFISQATTPNQRALAVYLDRIAGTATGDLQTVMNELRLLTREEVSRSLDLMSADFQGSLTQVGLINTTNMYSQLSTRLRPGLFGDLDRLLSETRPESRQPPPQAASDRYENGPHVIRAQSDYFGASQGWSGWAFGYGLMGRVTSDQHLDYRTNGTMFGLERFLDPGTLVGVYGNFSRSNITDDSLRRAAHVDNYTGGAYLRQDDGIQYTLLGGAVGYDRYDSSRYLQFAGINRNAGFDYEGFQYSLYFERGMTIDLNLIGLQPYLALQYINHRQHRFTEFGAGALNLSVGATSTNSLRSMIGGRFAWEVSTSSERMTILPELRVAWAHEYLNSSNTVNAKFDTTRGAGFVVTGANLGNDWALLGTGLKLQTNGHISLFTDYNAQVNDRQVTHTGSGGFEVQW